MFTLDRVVPWGRSFDEYCRMFGLTGKDLRGRFIGCGDGPASFNAEGTRRGHRIVSCDPLYNFGAPEIAARVAATSAQVLEQTRQNAGEFVWGSGIRDIDELAAVRMAAMHTFLEDYDTGKAAGRYVAAALPALPFEDRSFDLAVCSHLLFLYEAQLGEAFHRGAVREMARVASEVRVFPLLTLGGTPSAFVATCVEELTDAGCDVSIERVAYEFQRGGNRMLRIRHANPPRSGSAWLHIPLADYEAHMAAVGQSELLRRFFSAVYLRYRPRRLAVLGCTGGADLELIDPSFTQVAVGVDLNPAYIDAARVRLSAVRPQPTLIAADVLEVDLPPGEFDLIHAALLLEYVDPVAILRRVSEWLAPGGVCSILIQAPGPHVPAASRTGYDTLQGLADEMRLWSAAEVIGWAQAAELRLVEHRHVRAGEKSFAWLVLRR